MEGDMHKETEAGGNDDTMQAGVSPSSGSYMTEESFIGMEFNSIEAAEEFYKQYSRVMGFGVRTRDTQRGSDDMIIMRKWVCAKEGKRHAKYLHKSDRKREPKAITRVECKALFKVNYSGNSGKWCVTKFVADHSHELATPTTVPFIWSHRSLDESDKAQVLGLHGVEVRSRQMMDYLAKQSEGCSYAGFTKDLYNHIDAAQRDQIRDGDAVGASGYLSATERRSNKRRSSSGPTPDPHDIPLPSRRIRIPLDEEIEVIDVDYPATGEGCPLPNHVHWVSRSSAENLLRAIEGWKNAFLKYAAKSKRALKEAASSAKTKDAEIEYWKHLAQSRQHSTDYHCTAPAAPNISLTSSVQNVQPPAMAQIVQPTDAAHNTQTDCPR